MKSAKINSSDWQLLPMLVSDKQTCNCYQYELDMSTTHIMCAKNTLLYNNS